MTGRAKKFSDKEIRERAKTLERAKKVASETVPQWKADPNIVSLGYGLRSKKGKIKTDIVISFLVKRKVKGTRSIEKLGSRPIPAKIRGIPTDVVEVGVVKPQAATGERDDRAYDPLVGGCATSNADSHVIFWNAYGTLGSVCFDRTTGAPMALSNWHVWADGGQEGDYIIQPGHPRGEDWVEAVVEAAFCGTVENILEWEAPDSLSDVLYDAAKGSAAVAALSDVIDPSRKGQKKTPPGAGEFTDKESIDVKIDYLTQPIPGTPFKLKVDWDYTRHTNKKTYDHHEEEDIQNQHVLISKRLTANKTQYLPGEKVELFALLESDTRFDCDYYHVVAYLVPLADETRRIPVVLHPSLCSAQKVCVDFSGHEPDTTLPNQFTRLRALFKAPGGEKFRVVDRYQQDGKGELAIFTRGMSIKVPPSSAVEAHVVALGRELIMRAYNQGQPVGYTGAPRGQQVVHNLRIEGESIDYVDFMGGTNEASMLMFCYEPLQPVKGISLVSSDESQGKKICCYKGAVSLDPDEKPGKWKGYLFAQTVNVVPEGTPPEKAARILGGVGVTQNMEDARKVAGSLIGCGGHDIVDFMFQVV